MKPEAPLSVCATCRFAEWKKTSNGRRHPDGTGRCGYQVPDAPLPKWIHEWVSGHKDERVTSVRQLVNQMWSSRYIYRYDYHRTEPEPCATWEAATKADAVVAPLPLTTTGWPRA